MATEATTGVSKGPWMVNGQVFVGDILMYRIDALGEERTGVMFLRHPAAFVSRIEDAEAICQAMNERAQWLKGESAGDGFIWTPEGSETR